MQDDKRITFTLDYSVVYRCRCVLHGIVRRE